MPEPSDHNGVSSVVNTIADHICAAAERDDQLAITGTGGRAATFRLFLKRGGAANKVSTARVDNASPCGARKLRSRSRSALARFRKTTCTVWAAAAPYPCPSS